MKKIWILAVLTICSVATQAQEVFINADLVSSYIWRRNEEWKCFRTTHFGCRVERMDLISMGIDRIQKMKTMK